jgi:hypothetical protein
MNVHSGKSQDERVAARKQQQQASLEQPGGEMAIEGTEADATHSCGQLSDAGRRAWQVGTGMDGGGKSR